MMQMVLPLLESIDVLSLCLVLRIERLIIILFAVEGRTTFRVEIV